MANLGPGIHLLWHQRVVLGVYGSLRSAVLLLGALDVQLALPAGCMSLQHHFQQTQPKAAGKDGQAQKMADGSRLFCVHLHHSDDVAWSLYKRSDCPRCTLDRILLGSCHNDPIRYEAHLTEPKATRKPWYLRKLAYHAPLFVLLDRSGNELHHNDHTFMLDLARYVA